MLIRDSLPVVLCLLISTQCCNGLFENHHEKDETKMAVTRWRRSAESRHRAKDVESEMEENREMLLKNSQHHLAGYRQRYRIQRTGLGSEGSPVTHHYIRRDPRRHAIHSHVVPNTTQQHTTTTTHTPPSTTHPSTTISPQPPSSTTNNPPPNTMSETMESYFRPIDLNVPQDHLRPFQEFGKKLTAPSTTINTNTLEVTTSRGRYLNDSNLKNHSNLEDEFDEDMDVAFSKPFTEQNKASSRPHHIMFIKHGGVRRPPPPSESSGETLTAADTMNLREITTAQTVLTDKPKSHSPNETENLGNVPATLPRIEKQTEREGNNTFVDENDSHEELSAVVGNDTLGGEINGGGEGEKDYVIQQDGVLSANKSEPAVSIASIIKIITTTLSSVVEEKAIENLIPAKFVLPGSRNGTSFILLPRRRGLVYGTKKNVTTTIKPKPISTEEVKTSDEKQNVVLTSSHQPMARRFDENIQSEPFENYSKSPKVTGASRIAFGEKLMGSVSNDQQVENTITKHVRGNVTYKSQLLKSSRTPKTLQYPPENIATSKAPVQEVTTSTTTTLQNPPEDVATSKAPVQKGSTSTTTTVQYPTEDIATSKVPVQKVSTSTTTTLQYPKEDDATSKAPLHEVTTSTTTTLEYPPEGDATSKAPVQEVSSSSTTTIQSPEGENLTSKILSTAVVTSISVLGEWSPMLPYLQTNYSEENTTHIAPSVTASPVLIDLNVTSSDESIPSPSIQTKESMQVSYSRNVPKYTVSNSTAFQLSPNQSTTLLEMITNLTSTRLTTENTVTSQSRLYTVISPQENTTQVTEEAKTTRKTPFKSEPQSQQVTTRESKNTKFNIEEGTNTKDLKEGEKIEEPKTEVLTTTTPETEVMTSPTTTTTTTTMTTTTTVAVSTTDEPQLEDMVTSSVASDDTFAVPNTTPEVAVEVTEVSSPTTIQRKHDVEFTSSSLPVNATGPPLTQQVVVSATSDSVTETTTIVASSSTVTEIPTPKKSTSKPPRAVRVGSSEKTKVVYHTEEEEEVSSKPGHEGTPGNDVIAYILGTFGLISIVIGVLFGVKCFISRRKKIWESEKSPLTFVTTNEWEFPRSKLRLQTVLGQGNFGQVYKAEADDILGERATRLVAVKTIKDGGSAQEKEDLMRELAILKQIGAHSNVVTLLGCCTEKEPYYLILEYVMYGKLLSFLRDNRTRRQYYNFSEETAELTAKDLTSFAYCVARGMEYLTSKGIIHRDLAARNILVDHNKICKVADFGMSRSVSEPGEIYEQARPKGALPIRWMAPESLLYRVFTHKSDVWAFGILMWEIVTLGSTPYQNMSAREVIKQVRDGYRLERPDHCRPELYRVAGRCWSHDPSKRPTFGDLKLELADLLEQGEPQTYVDLDSYIESISGSNTRTKHVVNL